MGKQACRWCRVGRYYYLPEHKKFFNEPKLCFNCSIICDFNIQQLVPTSERSYNIDYHTKSNYLKSGNGDTFGCLGRSNSRGYGR